MVSKSSKPEFIKKLAEELNADLLKVAHSRSYFILRQKEKVYFVLKKETVPQEYLIDQKLISDRVDTVRSHSPELEPRLFLTIPDQSPTLQTPPPSIDQNAHFVIEESFLFEKYLLKHRIEKGKSIEDEFDAFFDFFEKYHSSAKKYDARSTNYIVELQDRIENLVYQSEKYTDTCITKSALSLIKNPLLKFLKSQEKVFLARVKNKKIMASIGRFEFHRVYLRKSQVLFSPSPDFSANTLFCDHLEDWACLHSELYFYEQDETAESFIQRACGKKEPLIQLNRFFMIMRSLEKALDCAVEGDDESVVKAKQYYRIASRFAQNLK